MTAAVKDLISKFETLSQGEQREAFVELVRRTAQWDSPPLADGDLVAIAETLFLQLDADEAADEATDAR